MDGCKYSSTGRRRRQINRLDQVKEHIKEKGHYGPHSPSDRAHRPGEPLFVGFIILARYEEWDVGKDSDCRPRRTVKACEFNSSRTKLWHLDDTAEALSRPRNNNLVADMGDLTCNILGCYYASQPPEGCEVVLIKTERALQEHRRRAHDEAPALEFGLISQLPDPRPYDIRKGSHAFEYINYSFRSELPSLSNTSDVDIATDLSPVPDRLSSAWLNGSQDDDCYLSSYSPSSSNATCISNTPGVVCCCQSCTQDVFQRGSLSHEELCTIPAQLPFREPQYQPVYSTSRLDDLWIPVIGNAPTSGIHRFGTTSESSTSSLFSEDPKQLRPR